MKYSVIIPIYNAEQTLERCLTSLVAQRRSDMELILVNDGSADGSERICLKYQKEYEHVRYISQENGGVSRARNVGLDHAKGEYILFVDSDDFVTSDYLETVDDMLKRKNTDLLLFSKKYTSGEAENAPYSDAILGENPREGLMRLFRQQQLNALPAKVFRREIIEKNHLRFQENLSVGEDALFVFGYILHVESYQTADQFVYMIDVSNGESLTRKWRPYLCDHFLEIHDSMFRQIENCSWQENEKKNIRSAVAWSFYRSVYSVCKDFRKTGWTSSERRRQIRKVCGLFTEKEIRPGEWKCCLIAIPVWLRMAAVIDFMTAMR